MDEQQWVTVWTAERPGKAGREACSARFEQRYRGKVAVTDSRVLIPADARACPQLQLKAEALQDAEVAAMSEVQLRSEGETK